MLIDCACFWPLAQSQTFMLWDHYLLNHKVFRTSKLLGTIHNMQQWDFIPCFLMLYTNLLPQNNNFFLNHWLPIHIPLWGEVLVYLHNSPQRFEKRTWHNENQLMPILDSSFYIRSLAGSSRIYVISCIFHHFL